MIVINASGASQIYGYINVEHSCIAIRSSNLQGPCIDISLDHPWNCPSRDAETEMKLWSWLQSPQSTAGGHWLQLCPQNLLFHAAMDIKWQIPELRMLYRYQMDLGTACSMSPSSFAQNVAARRWNKKIEGMRVTTWQFAGRNQQYDQILFQVYYGGVKDSQKRAGVRTQTQVLPKENLASTFEHADSEIAAGRFLTCCLTDASGGERLCDASVWHVTPRVGLNECYWSKAQDAVLWYHCGASRVL